MKIAVTYEKGEVFQHFGKTEQLKIYEIDQNKIINTNIIDTNGQGHGVLCDLLKNNNVDILLCGGLGTGAKNMLEENNIKVFAGVKGNTDKNVEDYLANKLEYDNEYKCNHHHHGEDHDCENHDCSKDKGGCTGNK